LAALYLWIRLDSQGPAFYQSERLGQDGKIFLCLKFRSMFVDADERLRDMLAADPARRLEYETYHKLDDDPRITRAGSVMRKYSLDELPQLYNVLAGEMSLVGPRPYLVGELKDMNGYDEAILEAKPGMTGYWQVSGRNEVTFDERLEMEAHYVRNWSIWWDIIILTQTVMVVLSRRGAK
jgi:lipopolysaccharide/colanic/teichoic acid biosynthesis glycosyltransferase